ncbi:hypothetical protein [Candidatus Thiosymbion oneisti]|uniref:hypothetical protein n=1 Tax=Candidatus Thiosymbion oneisti TaxID=589554 RepID=UPI000B7DFD08|nr:hypothetical protein [Candidatus Thiosymbion oneisti]
MDGRAFSGRTGRVGGLLKGLSDIRLFYCGIEASHSRSLKAVRYEFVGKPGDKKLDINVSADGRTIEVADR